MALEHLIPRMVLLLNKVDAAKARKIAGQFRFGTLY